MANSSSDENINSITFVWKVPEQLRNQTLIKIFGRTQVKAKRFSVNLKTDEEDIALHFNPRLKEDQVVRNSMIKNEWNDEERESPSMPFKKNQSFDLIIGVEEKVYRIFVNGIHFIDFSHRLSYSSVTSVVIDGEVEVYGIQSQQSSHDLDSISTLLSSLAQKSVIQNIFDPQLPFTHEISNGIRNGMIFTIIGRSLSNAKKFDINIFEKSADNPDIALHMSARFGDSVVVRNNRIKGQWGSEDKSGSGFPLSADKIFIIRIIVENKKFIIILNDIMLPEFANRLEPLSNANQLEIFGDLNLFSVDY